MYVKPLICVVEGRYRRNFTYITPHCKYSSLNTPRLQTFFVKEHLRKAADEASRTYLHISVL